MIEMIERYAALIDAQRQVLDDYERRQYRIAMLYRHGGLMYEDQCSHDE